MTMLRDAKGVLVGTKPDGYSLGRAGAGTERGNLRLSSLMTYPPPSGSSVGDTGVSLPHTRDAARS